MNISFSFQKLKKELLFILFSVSTLLIPFGAFKLAMLFHATLFSRVLVICCSCFLVLLCHDFYEHFMLRSLTCLTKVQKEETSRMRVLSAMSGIVVLIMMGCFFFSLFLLNPNPDTAFSQDQLLLMIGFFGLFFLLIIISRRFNKRNARSQGDVSCN